MSFSILNFSIKNIIKYTDVKSMNTFAEYFNESNVELNADFAESKQCALSDIFSAPWILKWAFSHTGEPCEGESF